jgi:hypothetical protein
MKHLSWKYRRQRTPQQYREFREAQRQRVLKRWAKVHAARAADPVRQTRTNRITIEDTHTTRTILIIRREQTERGWSRARVEVNGIVTCGGRAWTLRQLANAIGGYLQ